MKPAEPFLDGMPEDPPRWARPEAAVRLPALELEWALLAALSHTLDTGVAAEAGLLSLAAVHLSVHDGLLQTLATDRYSMIRERRPVEQTCDDWAFLLRVDDVKSLRMLLKNLLRHVDKDLRRDEPVDILVERTPEGRVLWVLGADLDVRFTETADTSGQQLQFPDVDGQISRVLHGCEFVTGDFDALLNPQLLARTVPLQQAGRAASRFRFRWAGESAPVVVTTWADDDDVVVVIALARLPEDEPDGGER